MKHFIWIGIILMLSSCASTPTSTPYGGYGSNTRPIPVNTKAPIINSAAQTAQRTLQSQINYEISKSIREAFKD